MRKILPIILIGFTLAGSLFTSCKKDPVSTGCDTCKKSCDTCNINKDSLARVKDSLAHAFTWKQFAIPGEALLTGVWVFGPNDIMICGNSLLHFDGTNFTLIDARDTSQVNSSLNGALNGNSIFAFSQNDFWLVSGSIAFHTTDGHTFHQFRPGTTNACWGSATNDVFVVGDGGHIAHFDGKSFTQMTSNTTEDLQSVWGTDHTHVWACGINLSTGQTTLVSYNGTQWSVDDLSNNTEAKQAGLEATWAFDSMVIVSGAFIYQKTDNSSWRVDKTVPNLLPDSTYRVPLYLIRGNTANDFAVAGDRGWVGHWSGKSWKRFDTLYDPTVINYSASQLSMNSNTICVVGIKNGNSWVAVGTRN